uniref:Elongation of very long chain fatty acids protein n=1 Tax=Acrobeloides nanus TaxID=290746 RepID=A0A914DWJ6_9BILA
MMNRPAYQLKNILVLWNSFLALFSILGSIRMGEEFMYSIFVLGDWVYFFGLSKIFELGDTVFLVLKKRPVTFLHVYHHCTVLMYTWITASDQAAIGRWFATLNFMAHSAMYIYYAFMSADAIKT